MNSLMRCKSGVPGLDEILRGGFIAERNPLVCRCGWRAHRESRRDRQDERVGISRRFSCRRPRMDGVHMHARKPWPQARRDCVAARLPCFIGGAFRVLLVQRDRARISRPDREQRNGNLTRSHHAIKPANRAMSTLPPLITTPTRLPATGTTF